MPRGFYPRPILADRFWAKVNKTDDCWLWTGATSVYGYGIFGSGNGSRADRAHRFALEQRLDGSIPAGFFSLHTCDVRACVRNDGAEGTYEVNGVIRVRYGHLWLGTHDDNMADMVAKGRKPIGDESPSRLHPETLARSDQNGARTHPERLARGERQGSAKLVEDQVIEIKRRLAAGERPCDLGPEYGVTPENISCIKHGKGWKHLSYGLSTAIAIAPTATSAEITENSIVEL